MKATKQTIFGYPLGNCFAACVASILEISISETPTLNGVERFDQTWGRWLSERNLGLADVGAGMGCFLRGYSIATGDSPRGGLNKSGRPVQHCVICKDMEMIFDPHPDETFLSGHPKYFSVLYPLDPMVRA